MITFFSKGSSTIFAVASDHQFSQQEIDKLSWLFGGALCRVSRSLKGRYVGPRKEMVTPWSTNAVEITQNMGLCGIWRIEEFTRTKEEHPHYDKMLQSVYDGLNQKLFTVDSTVAPIVYIDDIRSYNREQGLALSAEEEDYLDNLAKKLGRKLTDSEVFGFSQVNSEHCRHKIFNGRFIIDGEEKQLSLFKMIKRTSEQNPNSLVSAYKDNVAFVKGPSIERFAPVKADEPSLFEVERIPSVLSLKAETHNFPTTVEPFNGAATGTGGEIRDRLGGGKASLPLAGTAVYMTSYPRLSPEHVWELASNPRVWLYQTPAEILIKASNGASDFGNKFGQPLICGSLLTFEHTEDNRILAYDKVIMLAGGVGYADASDAIKGVPAPGKKVVLMGGDNYRIGMGGGAVSSVDTGNYDNSIELNAVQRANPEMQKRVANVIRALSESSSNPIISIHDHGAGGHLNALSELVEATGGEIDLAALPVGDPTLSDKEIIGNESQERMGMVVDESDISLIQRIADRERAPMYVVGETTSDNRFTVRNAAGDCPIDLEMDDMFGNSPRTIITDNTLTRKYSEPDLANFDITRGIESVLGLEAVACKDWLTNKVDRSVTGKIARQQCQGEIQLPLSDCGVVALDFTGTSGIATSIGHAPQVALIDAPEGSRLSIAEALTNIAATPLRNGLSSISLSANWMWPCKNPGEDAALYEAVKTCSDFACDLGINIPTGKDSLSMTQKYPDGKVFAPGTVIISAAGEVSDVKLIVSPVLRNVESTLYYIDFSGCKLALGGSALYQTLNKVGENAPSVRPEVIAASFDAVQQLVRTKSLLAYHDVSAGGLLTTLLEMTFANSRGGISVNADELCNFTNADIITSLFAENPAAVIQVSANKCVHVESLLVKMGVRFIALGAPVAERTLTITHAGGNTELNIDALRDVWFKTSYLLDTLQSGQECALARYTNYKDQVLKYRFSSSFKGRLSDYNLNISKRPHSGIKAAIIREKGINGDREMAYSLYLAGFDVKDVHMTDLMSGRETLSDVNMLVFCGGFSNSDVLGSAKGWAGGFVWNKQAADALADFYKRPDTLSLGVCNGCQLMMELGLITSGHAKPATMQHNISHKFESAFVNVDIPRNNSVMLSTLAGSRLGIWVAHGEGRFSLPMPRDSYNIAMRYSYSKYPGNPNGSRFNVAALCSDDGRHLAMMPHLERAIFPWQWAYYPAGKHHAVTPWAQAFANAFNWIKQKRQNQ